MSISRFLLVDEGKCRYGEFLLELRQLQSRRETYKVAFYAPKYHYNFLTVVTNIWMCDSAVLGLEPAGTFFILAARLSLLFK